MIPFICSAQTSENLRGMVPCRSWQAPIYHSPPLTPIHMIPSETHLDSSTSQPAGALSGYVGMQLVPSGEVAMVASWKWLLQEAPYSEHVVICSMSRLAFCHAFSWRSIHWLVRQHCGSYPSLQLLHTIVALLAISGQIWGSCIFCDKKQQSLYHSHFMHELPEGNKQQSILSVLQLICY